MKGTIILLLTILPAILFGQEKEIPMPEFIDQPYVWLKDTNTLEKLSKEDTHSYSNGVKVYLKYEGAASETKINSNGEVSFLIRTKPNRVATGIQIYRLDVNKKNRTVVISQQSKKTGNIIEYDVREVAKEVYELVVSSPIISGEYVIFVPTRSYSFSLNKN